MRAILINILTHVWFFSMGFMMAKMQFKKFRPSLEWYMKDRDMILNPKRWPRGDRLYLKRATKLGKYECGMIMDYNLTMVLDEYCEKLIIADYSNTDELLNDGWIVD